MKATIQACAIAALFAVPAVSFGQASNPPLTRAQVQAQLVQIEQAGYNPAAADNTHYPRDIQAAEARVQAQTPMTGTATGVGGAVNSAASGHPVSRSMGGQDWRSMFAHH